MKMVEKGRKKEDKGKVKRNDCLVAIRRPETGQKINESNMYRVASHHDRHIIIDQFLRNSTSGA